MMFLGEVFQNDFLCKQFEPDQARHNNVRPHSAFTPCADQNGGGGEGVKRIPSKISQKYSFFSNWSGPLKNHKATQPHFYVWPIPVSQFILPPGRCPGISCPPPWLSSTPGGKLSRPVYLAPRPTQVKYMHVILLFFCIILMNSDPP